MKNFGNFLLDQGEDFHLSDPTIERKICVKYLDILIDKHLNFIFHIAEVVRKFSKLFSAYHE